MAISENDYEQFERADEFWSPQVDEWYSLVLANWRIENIKFKDETEAAPTLVMDILNINGIEYASKPKKFSRRSRDLIKQLKPIFLGAQNRGVSAVRVKLRRAKDSYVVVEIPRE